MDPKLWDKKPKAITKVILTSHQLSFADTALFTHSLNGTCTGVKFSKDRPFFKVVRPRNRNLISDASVQHTKCG